MGFGFKQGSTAVESNVSFDSKRTNKLTRDLIGCSSDTSLANLMSISHLLTHRPDHLRLTAMIVDDKDALVAFAKKTNVDTSGFLACHGQTDIKLCRFRGRAGHLTERQVKVGLLYSPSGWARPQPAVQRTLKPATRTIASLRNRTDEPCAYRRRFALERGGVEPNASANASFKGSCFC